MKTLEEIVVTTMDGSDKELFPYLAYILQDLWAIGTDPNIIIRLIRNHFGKRADLKILDLGCGKGAVSVKVADSLGYNCYGIDAIPEFISYAQKKADEFKVAHLCAFEVGDIREKVKTLANYDIIILGAIGPVFGDYLATLVTLSPSLGKNGIFLIDDGYIENNSNYKHSTIQKQETIIEQIDLAGMQLIENVIIQKKAIRDTNEDIFKKLKNRCEELINTHPDKKDLFTKYIESQIEENQRLENKLVCSTMVIEKKEL